MPTFPKKKIVCFGGGTGLPSLLAGLKHNPWLEITAIVNMFDSGGSSGELMDRFGILPPGDIFKCLLALSEDDVIARKLLLKRIRSPRLPGHTGGNVLLMGLEKVYGNYAEALNALGQILSVKGTVIPVAFEPSTLCARYTDGMVFKGEAMVDVGVGEGKEIEELFLEPVVPASAEAIDAIREADVMCIGPGSFYTSVLPNFLPDGIREAIAESTAPVIFACNLLTEGPGMRGYTIGRLVQVVESAIGRPVTKVLANMHVPDESLAEKYAQERKHLLMADELAMEDERIIAAELWTDRVVAHHDPSRLAALLSAVIHW